MSTKEQVLLALQEAAGQEQAGMKVSVSGEALAASCRVSRTAVWKAIQALERDGYGIEAAPNRGYRLRSVPDRIDGGRIFALMEALGARPGAVYAFDEIDSTLSEPKRREAALSVFRTADGSLTEGGALLHRAVFATGRQTAGRGRMGRPFVSPANTGVYFTLVYAPHLGVTNPALLTAAAAVAVARAIDALYGTSCQIKWVNDVFAGGKKISGILTEGFASLESGRIEAANVGIGINIRPMDGKGFSGELAKVAGCIEDALAADGRAMPAVSRNELVARVCAELLAFYDALENGDGGTVAAMLGEYRGRSLLAGKIVRVNPAAGLSGETYSARVLDITDAAALVVEREDGTRQILQSGEVSLHSYDFAL